MSNKNNLFIRGSEWRKWDLQIHPPESKLNDQYKSYDSTDIWDKFFDYLKKSDVGVFGITDYFSIDGYKKLMDKVKHEQKLKQKVFFPNIEFRMDISLNKAKEQLQCHLIFDNQCKVKQIENFLSHLRLENKKTDGSTCFCIDQDIIECGGYDRVSVTDKNLKKALNDTFGKFRPYLIVGLATGMGSCRATPNSNVKKELADNFDEFCDFFFGNETNRDYYLKEDRYENKDKKAIPKAVVATSDCHSLDDCDKKLGKKFKEKISQDKDIICYGFTWIKADTTFEGLRQILYEPFDRVAFGYERPDKKKSYFLIDKVRFIDNSGQDNFQANTFEINPNLTTIIGGKSTGKSLLLYYTAKTIDSQEVKTRFLDDSTGTQYDFDESPDFNFEVLWADGESTFLKIVNDSSRNNERKILYIPQNYLNKISEKNVKSKEMLNKFVKDVLLQDETVNEQYEKSLSQIKALSKLIPSSVNGLYQLKLEITEIEENIKQLGKEKGIKKYLSQLQKEADEIKIKSGLSEQEIKDYEKLLSEEKEATTSTAILSEDKKSIALFRQNITQQLENLEELRDEQISYLGDKRIKDEFKKELDSLDTIKINLLASVDKIISSITSKIETNNENLDKIKKGLTPFMAKIKLQDELAIKNDAVKEEQKRLDRIGIERKNLKSKKSNYDKGKKSLVELYKSIFDVYNSIRNEFKKYDNSFDDISLNVSVGFNEMKFNNVVIQDSLNKRDIKRILNNVKWKDEFTYQYDQLAHLDFISELFNAVLGEKIKTIKNKPPKEAVLKILEDYFYIDFKIKYKEDSLDKMSPGKKGLVLLRLLIDLSNKEWPILLDQPDDDLDNRSVYYDLVSFVKKKKKHRQIILITHNPNLVVGTDAEEVIVANQEGQEKGRENKKYKFEYISGALENTFELSEKEQKAILFRKGIRQHACEVLEGGKEAFQKREKKYSFDQ